MFGSVVNTVIEFFEWLIDFIGTSNLQSKPTLGIAMPYTNNENIK